MTYTKLFDTPFCAYMKNNGSPHVCSGHPFPPLIYYQSLIKCFLCMDLTGLGLRCVNKWKKEGIIYSHVSRAVRRWDFAHTVYCKLCLSNRKKYFLMVTSAEILSHYLREKELITNFYPFHVALLSNNWSEKWTTDHKMSTQEKLRLEKVKNWATDRAKQSAHMCLFHLTASSHFT